MRASQPSQQRPCFCSSCTAHIDTRSRCTDLPPQGHADCTRNGREACPPGQFLGIASFSEKLAWCASISAIARAFCMPFTRTTCAARACVSAPLGVIWAWFFRQEWRCNRALVESVACSGILLLCRLLTLTHTLAAQVNLVKGMVDAREIELVGEIPSHFSCIYHPLDEGDLRSESVCQSEQYILSRGRIREQATDSIRARLQRHSCMKTAPESLQRVH
jgi:hypothetical protein